MFKKSVCRLFGEMRLYRDVSILTPFTTKATIGTALFGSLVLGMKTSTEWREPRDPHCYRLPYLYRPDNDIASSMFKGALGGAIAGFLWPVTLITLVGVVPVYAIHRGFVVYAKK